MTKQIESYSKYTINESGEVISHQGLYPRKLKPQRATQSKKGYYQVRLYDNSGKLGKLNYLHRLTWQTFRGQIPKGMEIDHMNGDTTDNKLSNLQLLSKRNNKLKHSRETQEYLLREQRDKLCQDYDTLGTFKAVAKKWGVSITAVNRVVRNRTHYKTVDGKFSTRVYDINLSDKWTLN